MTKTNPPIVIDALPTQAEVEVAAADFIGTLSPVVSRAITTPAEFSATANMLRMNKGDQVRLKEALDKILAPMNAAIKATRALFAPAQERLVNEESALKRDILNWNRALEQKQRELQAKVDADRRAAEAKAEKKAEKLEAAGKVEQAEAVRESVPPAAIIQVETTKVAGLVERDTWKAEVTDFMDLLKWALNADQLETYFAVNQVAINAYARANKGNAKMPGVRFWAETGLASGRS